MVRMRKHVDGLHGFDGVLAVEQRQIARLSSRIATHIYYGAGSGVENHVDYILVHACPGRVDNHHFRTPVFSDKFIRKDVLHIAGKEFGVVYPVGF